MKFRLIAIILVIIFTFTGCFSYRDINRVLFDLAILIDIDDNGNIILYTECFKAFKGVSQGIEQGVRIVNRVEGKTIFEAVRNSNLDSGYKHNYTQNKAIIFTERAARRGLKDVLDFLDRDQEFLIRPYVFVYMGDVDQLIHINIKDEEYLGTYLYSLIQNIGTASRAVIVNLNEFLNRRYMLSSTEVVSVLRVKEKAVMDKIQLDGGAVIQNDRMVDYIPIEQSQAYNFLRNEVDSGTLEVTNPSYQDGYVTLEIVKSRTKTRIKYDGRKIKLYKFIKVNTSIGEVQYKFEMTEDVIKKIEEEAERNIKKYCKELFEEYKMKKIDIFEIADELHRYYPKVKIENPIEITELNIVVDVNVEGSSKKLDFR